MTLQDLFIERIQSGISWHPSRNGDLEPEQVPEDSEKAVWWQCQRGHSWKTKASAAKKKLACPYCAGRLVILGETDLATTHPQLQAMWSGRNEITPQRLTAGSHKKVWWTCDAGHEWEAMVCSVASGGTGCPYCRGKKPRVGENDLASVRPEILSQWDRERNGELTPERLLSSSHEKVWWRCQQGHSWQAMVFSRSKEKSTGCPYCTGKKALAGFNDLATLRPDLAEEWDRSRNGELKPDAVTLGSNKRVWWKCAEGHVWHAVIYSRTRKRGAGCPICTGSGRRAKHSGPELFVAESAADNCN